MNMTGFFVVGKMGQLLAEQDGYGARAPSSAIEGRTNAYGMMTRTDFGNTPTGVILGLDPRIHAVALQHLQKVFSLQWLVQWILGSRPDMTEETLRVPSTVEHATQSLDDNVAATSGIDAPRALHPDLHFSTGSPKS